MESFRGVLYFSLVLEHCSAIHYGISSRSEMYCISGWPMHVSSNSHPQFFTVLVDGKEVPQHHRLGVGQRVSILICFSTRSSIEFFGAMHCLNFSLP